MGNITIDIVLLPDKKMTEKSIALNHQLKDRNDALVLSAEKGLPHITLVMGCISKDKLALIEKEVGKIANDLRKLRLRILEVDFDTNQDGTPNTGLEVENKQELQSLHEKIANILKPYLLTAEIDSLYQDPVPDEITLSWVNNFLKKSSFKNYRPHITIGLGKLENIQLPIVFTVDKIAICHLGNYCTCQKVIKEFNLR